jgi:CTP synthase (UTP-ammonia lyase)
MEELIRAERRNLPRGATLVVVTAVISDDMLDIITAIRRSGHPVTLVETAGSQRIGNMRRGVSTEALRAQGIDYYLVDALGQAATLEKLRF